MVFYDAPCLNPWGYSSEIEIIKDFLKSRGIDPVRVYRKRVYPPDTNFCDACFCPTGYGVFIVIFKEDEPEAIDLGFLYAG